jgi:hypothetical protein
MPGSDCFGNSRKSGGEIVAFLPVNLCDEPGCHL